MRRHLQVLVCSLMLAVLAVPTAAMARPGQTQCPAAPPSDVAVALVFMAKGTALSSVALDEKLATMGSTVIVNFTRPTRLVLSSRDPMIFHLSGTLDMVEGVVLAGRNRLGVTGIPRSKISHSNVRDCLPNWFDISTARYSRWPKPLAAAGGRNANVALVAQQGAGGMITDSAAKAAPPAPYRDRSPRRQDLLDLLYSTYPSGMVQIDREKLISTSQPIPHALMPGPAGLGPLVSSGKLQLTHSASGRLVAAFANQQIDFPMFACRGNSIRFMIPANIQIPSHTPDCEGRILPW
ncbi:MAG: hypothetical protein Alpg2KO_16920 [Alphaproteobacteria bacterium]